MEKKNVANFNVVIPKAAKSLAKFVGKDEFHPTMQYVAIIPAKGIIAATDTKIMQVYNAECNGQWPNDYKNSHGNLVDFNVLVDAKQFAKLAGTVAYISVSEYEKEVEETIYMRKQKVMRRFATVEIDGVEVYDGRAWNYPDVMRVIPKREGRKEIRLNTDNLDALKKICKLHKSDNYITLATEYGSDTLTIHNEQRGYDEKFAYKLQMEGAAQYDLIIGISPALFATTLGTCNGTLLIDDDSRPILVEGDALATVQMPAQVGYESEQAVRDAQKEYWDHEGSIAGNMRCALHQLREKAQEYWQHVLNRYTEEGKCGLNIGNWSAKEVADKKKIGLYALPSGGEFGEFLTILSGRVRITIPYAAIFATLAKWETLSKEKSVFSVGNTEEVTETVYVIQADGIAEEKKKLRKLGGNWYTTARRGKNDYEAPIYCKVNGKIVQITYLSTNKIDDAEKFAKWSDGKEKRIPEEILKMAEKYDGWRVMAETIGISAPQAAETPQISTQTAKVESLPTKDIWDDIVPDEQTHKTVKMVSGISSLIQKHGFQFYSLPGNAQLWRLHKNGELITGFMTIPQLWQWLTDYDRKITPQSQNKSRVSSVLNQAHELYNDAFIGSTHRI